MDPLSPLSLVLLRHGGTDINNKDGLPSVVPTPVFLLLISVRPAAIVS